ncbi:MAG: GNAT family N-acetyltransferase [Candidatus Latescibacterota bacterium]
MSGEIVQLTGADFQDAIDFLNLVFGTHAPHDFESFLPAIYQPTEEAMACNHAVRVGGRIRAIVGLFPLTLQVGATRLRVGGIGGVSTHPKARRAGHMRALMTHCVDLMRQQGYHLSYLGGQRQRYQYFGYERCGALYSYALNGANLRHCFGQEDTGIRFEPLEGEQAERLQLAQRMHDSQPAHCLRAPGNFHNHLRNWHNRPQAALSTAGDMVGYLVATARGDRVYEVAATDEEVAERLLRAWVATAAGGGTTVELPATRAALGRGLGRWCEHPAVSLAGNFQVFNWQQVLEALLAARALAGPLLPGRVVIGITGQERLELAVEGGQTACTATTAPPHVEWDAHTALRALFGPLRPSAVVELPARAAVLEQWCPLPLSWPHQDGV